VSIDDRLLSVFRGVFDPHLAALSDSDSPETIGGWDSANHVNLVLALEAEFGVEFDADEIAELTTVATIRERLAAE
jgi:acyl carrier protein